MALSQRFYLLSVLLNTLLRSGSKAPVKLWQHHASLSVNVKAICPSQGCYFHFISPRFQTKIHFYFSSKPCYRARGKCLWRLGPLKRASELLGFVWSQLCPVSQTSDRWCTVWHQHIISLSVCFWIKTQCACKCFHVRTELNNSIRFMKVLLIFPIVSCVCS